MDGNGRVLNPQSGIGGPVIFLHMAQSGSRPRKKYYSLGYEPRKFVLEKAFLAIKGFDSRLLALGYAYPAFLCFKTLEKNRVGIQELRFWCQYWLPMYRGMKLALFIYLWHPNIKGSDYVYETLVRPYFAQYEKDIDRSIFEYKERALNLAIYYCHNCTEFSTKKVLQFFQFVISQSRSITLPSSQIAENQQPNVALPAPAPTPPSTPSGIFKRNKSDKRRPPILPPGSSTSHLSQTPRSESFKVQLHNQTQFIHPEDILIPDPNIDSRLEEKPDGDHAAGDKIKSN
ncbi:hypothetical protein DH2020_014903 [Rehmannia glutinosa]|uniref:HVA22-like protein n=1 Tax=Rehmannia glutinosa TaxID=99300 RepID=A0ABR0WZA9_REHGL